ncbi:hypothetical protein ZWY2020_023796 [Hordeum vulgare]|nr:hypothetical protein ZWY2020_023796 [Hordeum vulgare]
MDADVEGQHAVAPQGDRWVDKMRCPGLCDIAAWALSVIIFVFWLFYIWPVPHYYVGIGSVSGVPAAAAAVNPAFNITLGVASWNYIGGACVYRGMSVEVAYRGVPLAGARASRLCAGARKVAEQPVVARREGVSVPARVMDALAADTRRGEQVFDVTVQSPWTIAGKKLLYRCRVGVGPSGAAWCSERHMV